MRGKFKCGLESLNFESIRSPLDSSFVVCRIVFWLQLLPWKRKLSRCTKSGRAERAGENELNSNVSISNYEGYYVIFLSFRLQSIKSNIKMPFSCWKFQFIDDFNGLILHRCFPSSSSFSLSLSLFIQLAASDASQRRGNQQFSRLTNTKFVIYSHVRMTGKKNQRGKVEQSIDIYNETETWCQ